LPSRSLSDHAILGAHFATVQLSQDIVLEPEGDQSLQTGTDVGQTLTETSLDEIQANSVTTGPISVAIPAIENIPSAAGPAGIDAACIVPARDERNERTRLLLVAAEPEDWTPLGLDEEVALIKDGIRHSYHRDRFELRTLKNCRLQDLLTAVLEQDPHYVHFAGHGTPNSLVIMNDRGYGLKVKKAALAELIRQASNGSLRGLVFNACWSANDAPLFTALGLEIIAMRRPVGDDAALWFSALLYDWSGDGKSFGEAFSRASRLVKRRIRQDFRPELFRTGKKKLRTESSRT
jgi:hypothetical protein